MVITSKALSEWSTGHPQVRSPHSQGNWQGQDFAVVRIPARELSRESCTQGMLSCHWAQRITETRQPVTLSQPIPRAKADSSHLHIF